MTAKKELTKLVKILISLLVKKNINFTPQMYNIHLHITEIKIMLYIKNKKYSYFWSKKKKKYSYLII